MSGKPSILRRFSSRRRGRTGGGTEPILAWGEGERPELPWEKGRDPSPLLSTARLLLNGPGKPAEAPLSTPAPAVFEPRSGETWHDPFPMYAALRERDPVHPVRDTGQGRNFRVLSRFRDGFGTVVDAATFSSEHGLTVSCGEKEELGIEAPIVMLGPPEHTAERELGSGAARPRRRRPREPSATLRRPWTRWSAGCARTSAASAGTW